MAKKPSLTRADGITADVVVELSQFYSSNDLRSVQSKLTGTAREIRNLTDSRSIQGRIGEKLSLEQLQLLRDAAHLIDSVNDNITHAKERKKRTEDAKAAWRKQRNKEAILLSGQAFPLPADTLDKKLEIIQLAFLLHRLRHFMGFCSATEFHKEMREDATELPKFGGWTPHKWRLQKLSSYRRDMLENIQNAITCELDNLPVQQQLEDLQKRIADVRTQVLADPAVIETLHIWSEALSADETSEVQP